MALQRTVRLTEAGLHRLDEARRRLAVSRDDLANARETPSANTVRKALRGEPVFPRTLERIGDYLARRATDLGKPFERFREGADYAFDDTAPAAAPARPSAEVRGWVSRLVPPPNRLFTGRVDVLERLHAALTAPVSGVADPQALTGMGGVGKTQTAIAYVFAFRHDYGRIFWANAESRATLEDSLAEIARELALDEGQGSEAAAEHARDWFRRESDWLLVLDNADDLEAIAPHFPPRHGGRILLTTRASVTVRWADDIPLAPLCEDDGATLLLRRAGRLKVGEPLSVLEPPECDVARAIAEDLGGLPLAIGQAGAFLGGTTRTMHELRAALRERGIDALASASDPEHAPVDVTLRLAFARLAESPDPRPADLLRLCAALDGALVPNVLLAPFGDRALAEITGLSLAIPRPEGVSVHRLVLDAVRRGQWDSHDAWLRRAVEAVAAATPDFDRPEWPTVAPLLPQWRLCARYIENLGIETPAAAHLLYQAGRYLRIRALYDEAEAVQLQAVVTATAAYGGAGIPLSDAIDELACLYREVDRLDEAAPLHARAVSLARAAEGDASPVLASRLHNQALCDAERGELERAADGFRQALAIRRRSPGDFRYEAAAWTQLGGVLRQLGRMEEAERAFRDALDLYRDRLDPEHADVGIGANNLAMLLVRLGRTDEAEALFETALRIVRKYRGPEHPESVTPLWGMARTRRAQGRLAEALALFDEVERVFSLSLPPHHVRLRNVREEAEACRRAAAPAV